MMTENSFSSQSSNIEDSLQVDKLATAVAFRVTGSRTNTFCGEQMFKYACCKTYNLALKEFLQTSAAGEFLLTTYKHEKQLTSTVRNVLIDLIINGSIW